MTYPYRFPSSSVCRDGSCRGEGSCFRSTIPYVVASCKGTYSCGAPLVSNIGDGPPRFAQIGSAYKSCNNERSCYQAIIGNADSSCNGNGSCRDAQIGSVDSSCSGLGSCRDAQLSGADLINSCNKVRSCKDTNRKGAFTELIDCCNYKVEQCRAEYGNDIVADGCVSHICEYYYCFFIRQMTHFPFRLYCHVSLHQLACPLSPLHQVVNLLLFPQVQVNPHLNRLRVANPHWHQVIPLE